MFSLQKIRDDIAKQNYSAIKFTKSKEYLDEAADSFLDFLTLPQELKSSMHLLLDKKDRGSNLGYVNRDQKEGDLDDKEYFHYRQDIKKHLGDLDAFNNPKVKTFLEHADQIYNSSITTLGNLLNVLEEGYPNISSYFFDDNKPFRGYLRFLKYNVKNHGDILAIGHKDRGTITLALAESAPGLRIGKNEKSLQEVEHKNYTTLFMPSSGFPIITDKSFPPAWHDVIKKGDDLYSESISRWAIVFFADAHNLKFPTFEETHTIIS